ncbi:DUF6760 family protein [Streptomyces murinus]|uniref:DUF6760 family protein n=1 Tax=Streptomyces murinus TaxID=33900 RepID=UPI003B75C149
MRRGLPQLRYAVRPPRTLERPGGIVTYPPDRLCEEEAYIAYYFHWPLDAIRGLNHRERLGWVREINRINSRSHEEG